MQRHVQHYNIDAKVGSGYSPIVGFQVDAMFGGQELKIEGCLKRSTLKQICEESNNEPGHYCSPYKERYPLKGGGAEYPTIEGQDRKLDYSYCKCILYCPCQRSKLDGEIALDPTITRPDIMSFRSVEVCDLPCPSSMFAAVVNPIRPFAISV